MAKFSIIGGMAAILCMACGAADAVDVDPGDYTALKPGTNLALLYNTWSHSDYLQAPGLGKLDAGTSSNSFIQIARFARFTKIGPFVMDPDIVIPFGTVYGTRVAGKRLNKASGIGDLAPFTSVYFINKPDERHSTYLAWSPIVSFPVGNYDHRRSVNLSSNRFTYDMQFALTKGLAKGFTQDVVGDAIWYGKNGNYGPDSQTLRQKNTFSLQTYSRIAVSPKSSIALGYAGYWGGRQFVDGAYNGTKTENQQVRLSLQSTVASHLQLTVTGSHMMHVEGGFREQVRLEFRILSIF